MKIKSEKDFFCGLMFVVVGIAFAWASTNYKIGNGARMGPGYFPLLLGTLLALLGAVVIFKSLVVETEDGEKIGKWARKPLFFIITSNLIFGVLLGGLPSIKLPSLGLIAAIYALAMVAALAGEEFKLKEVVVLATVLAVISYVAFVVLIKLQFQVWPAFITG
jgi:hypothetical protein